MTEREIFVEELAGVYESGPIVKVHLASVVLGGSQPERAVVCRLVGTTSDMRQIAARILDAVKADNDLPAADAPEREAALDEVVIGTVS
jgi:hypothetical protein